MGTRNGPFDRGGAFATGVGKGPFISLALIAMLAGTAIAAPGDLDTTFGGAGIVTTRVAPGETSGAQAVTIQPDGKIVVAGGTQSSEQERFALVRYSANGSLDTTFGGDGKVATRFAARLCVVADAVAVQLNGKIVAAGIAGCRHGRFALARYNVHGSLDTTFGGDGRVITRFRSGRHYSEAFGVVVQSDGKIVAAGVCCHSSAFALARYNSNGSLDTTFGGDGRVITDFTARPDYAFGVAIQSDDKIVAAGVAAASWNNARFALARYNPNGSLDTTFGGDGKVTTQPGDCISQAQALVIQTDGEIVAAGSAGCIDEFALARYDPDGTLDTTFGGDGTVTTDFGCPQSTAYGVAIQDDLKVVAAGFVVCAGATSEEYSFGTARYDPDGTLDDSFGGDGQVTTVIWDPECYQAAKGVAIQTDGKIVAAGGTVCGSRHTKVTLARYLG